MKVYDKRVAMVISSQHLHPNGGIGQFCKSFCEMAGEFNWKVDIILDKPPILKNNVLYDFLKNLNFIYTNSPVSYVTHSNLFMFGDSINIEKMLNFRTSIIKALSRFSYDLIVCNTPESVPAVYFLNVADKIPVVSYTHIENAVFMDAIANDTFRDCFTNFIRTMAELPHVITGTQSQNNADEIKKHYSKANAISLPMPVPERGLLEMVFPHKKGVLFIGRFEDRKNPTLFAKVVAAAGLPAKVLTKPNSIPKFEELFKKFGITDYEIKSGIIGKEKVDFIKSAKVAFHPSKRESYGFSAFETLHSCPTLLIEEFEWWKNHPYAETCKKDDAVAKLKDMYASANTVDAKDYVHDMQIVDMAIKNTWKQFMIDNPRKGKTLKANNSLYNILKDNPKAISIEHFMNKILNRIMVSVDDIESLNEKIPSIHIFQTDTDTFMSMTETPEFPEEKGISSFF
jgi:glycosyltransferase involved in cell wall biosynthesis